MQDNSDENLAPRKQMGKSKFIGPISNHTIHVTLIMSEREKEIEIGTTYPFGPLK